MPFRMRYWLLISAIAAAYFVAALLGLLLAVPPSNAGAVWPPAGIALACILLFGVRIWPAIFLGNFAASAWAFGFDAASLWVYAATGTGATANALVGRWLIRRCVGFPNRLVDDAAIIKFFLLGGPVSCLIPATVGLTAMGAAGIVSPGDVPFNWLSWWAGDTIGVFLFAPIVFLLFGEPRQEWRQRRPSVGLPLGVTFLLVVAFFLYANELERGRQAQAFQQLTSTLLKSFEGRFVGYGQSLMALEAFFHGSQKVEAEEFSLFSARLISQFPEMVALHWYIHAGAPGAPPRFVHRFGDPTSVVNVPPTPDQVLTGLPLYRAASIGTDFQMVYHEGHIDLYMPVYALTKVSERENLEGILLARISIHALVKEASRGLSGDYVLSLISAISTHKGRYEIFSHPDLDQMPDYGAGLKQEAWLTLGSDRWQFTFFPSAPFLAVYHSWAVWWVLVSGLLFASVLGVGLLMLTGRYILTEEIVQERTAELTHEVFEHQRTETALQLAKERAESASLAKSQFLANVSHELRTPLNGILGFSQLLLKRPSISGEEKSYVEIIRQSGDYLLALIYDILDLSKIEAGKSEIVAVELALNPFIDNVAKIFRLRAEEKGLTFNVANGIPPGCRVYADEKKLRQIFVNLLGNAVKFTDSGAVTLAAAYVGGRLQFSVKDTGPGIDSCEIEKMFQPFVQLGARAGNEEGTGLGLAITQKLIQLMKGEIQVESEVGRGTFLSVTIPLDEATEEAESSSRPSLRKRNVLGYKGPMRTLLVVDDNENNLQLMKSSLEAVGFQVLTATTGEQCLRLFATSAVDLVLMDMVMPDMDGLETTRRLLQTFPERAPRVIGISASAFQQEMQALLDAGCVSFVAKPILFEELFEIIGSVLQLEWLYQTDVPAASRSVRVLVADDNKINRLLLSHLLENVGCQVETAENGLEALHRLEKDTYDLALIDLRMPEMNGIEVIRRMRSDSDAGRRVKFYAISAYSEAAMMQGALESGFDGYLTKPIDTDQLRAIVDSLIEERQ